MTWHGMALFAATCAIMKISWSQGLIKDKDTEITCMVTWHKIIVEEEHMHGWK